ncbi:hemolysin family protein [Xylella fastidiosa]|uniref:hemolysin family protein n=1 Tax=Xylella fastidiosa TaxID=2371 RepID=UPI000707EE82|nr:hemolysin family protein [Xylella fastidiosa]KQH73339.1 hemolysin [Xylella fastidiosa]WNY19589.1 hemolysin family protein [Xylella fastidiosa]WNY21883.1 hemolysin family protein [Xylella fastidiosa]
MFELLIVIALIFLNGFFAMSEMSLMTSRKSRLKQMAHSSKHAAKALTLAQNPESFLSTVQIGITLIGILTGLFGGDAIGTAIGQWLTALTPQLGEYTSIIGKTLSVALITFLTLIFGELVPKRLALTHSEKIASTIAVPMSVLARIAAPGVWVLAKSTQLVLRVFGFGKIPSSAVTEEEIRLLVAESHEAGVIDDYERNMMNRVMRLGDRTADSLMTPRNRIAWLDNSADLEHNLEIMREHQFSRYPVYRSSDQDIVGILEVKSVITRIDSQTQTTLSLFQELCEPVFVSESTHALKLLEIFREEQQSMALVVDEYGEILGLVTISDLMGAVIGRLQNVENTDEDALMITREDGSFLIDGTLPIEELREVLGAELPDGEENNYHTLAGMCISYFGRIPHVGEYFDWAGWRIEIVDLDGARIDKLLLQRLNKEKNHVPHK